jgi:YVTN family beta-propeller protein
MAMSELRTKTIAFTLAVFALTASNCLAATKGAAADAKHGFRVETRWDVGGDGGWGDPFVEGAAHRLYIPRANRVMVVDTETGKVTGEVPGFVTARAVAVDDAGKYAYVTDLTDGTAGFVRIFDRSTLKLVKSIAVGINPDGIVFEPSTKTVFALNTRSRSVTVIDSATNEIIATIALTGRGTSVAVDGKGSVFVVLRGLGQIARIDAAARKATASWPLAPCDGPTGLAVDAEHRQLISSCENGKLIAVNADNGKVTMLGEIAEGAGDIDFDPQHRLLYIASGAGTLTVFRRSAAGTYVKLQEIDTQPGARAMAINPGKAMAYLVTSKYGPRTGEVSEELQFRPTPVAGTFSVIVVGQ